MKILHRVYVLFAALSRDSLDTLKRLHLGDDHGDVSLRVSEKVEVTHKLLSQVGGYDGLCKQLMQNKRLREVKCVLNEDNDFRNFCNFLKVFQTFSVIDIKNGSIAGLVNKIQLY